MHVAVLPYDPQWRTDFLAIQTELVETLHNCTYNFIEHVGSTSVPGLPAKPAIDIDIIVGQPQLDAVIRTLQEAGHTHLGDRGIPDRHAFRMVSDLPARNLYVCIEGCQSLRNHLAVRDICRSDPMIRDEYARVKLELAQKDWHSVDEYCEAKNDVLSWVLGQAGISQEDRDTIRKLNTDQST